MDTNGCGCSPWHGQEFPFRPGAREKGALLENAGGNRAGIRVELASIALSNLNSVSADVPLGLRFLPNIPPSEQSPPSGLS